MTDFDAYERELWAGRADAYERGFARLTAHTVEPLLDAAGARTGRRVLDLGTGPGIVAAAALRRGAVVSAVDADPQMARTAARNAPEAEVRVAVLPVLPHEDEAFDAVAGNFVINHVGEPETALWELRRVLRTGGRAALTCWRMPGSGVLALVRDAMDQVGVPWPDDVPPSPFMEHGRPDAFGDLMGRVFGDVAVEELTWDFEFEPEEWWRTGALARVGSNGVVLARQDAATIARVKDAYDGLLKPYAAGNGRVRVPAHALLARGTR
ncbi:class I SAM-dependent methyltransferase [Actinoallomurus rhizosphaericola]|uniref:class I SAM-dependent methyltransferase n=1 Tax=Actinoallomurus rhizosphaericola TaxID=2952536 RepID=UPI0020937205|nr:class I SAM-dependent methyltransferase [Actinoallomurus rhizosphaericola]MCO5995132.1 class I SAM-dependent methyltransferase [Actinoallomurus rhizosphaericola]